MKAVQEGPVRALVALAVALALTTALARPAEAHRPVTNSVWVPAGVTLAASLDEDADAGFVVGGEVSVVYLDETGFWVGGYVDTVYDVGPDATRLTVGPEAGFGFVGMDGGYAVEWRGGTAYHGGAARFLLTWGVVAVYGRVAHFVAPGPERTLGEVGVLLKWPIEMFRVDD